MEAGQTALRSEMKAGHAALGKRIDDLNVRMTSLEKTMLTLFRDVVKDLDLRHTESSLLSRQLKALREYAQDDPKLTEILRSLSLL